MKINELRKILEKAEKRQQEQAEFYRKNCNESIQGMRNYAETKGRAAAYGFVIRAIEGQELFLKIDTE